MPYSVTYLGEDDIVFTEYMAPVEPQALFEAMLENLRIQDETGALRFLGDCRQLPLSGGPREVFELAESLERAGFDRRSTEALVVCADSTEPDKDCELFARAASRNGLRIRVFATVEDAQEWLRTCRRTADD